MSQVVEASLIKFSDIRSHALNKQIGVFKEVIEKLEGFVVSVPVLPRPSLKIRSAKKRLIRLDEGKIARLEYAFIRSILESASPTIEATATLAGDFKAAIGYLLFLASRGTISFAEPSTTAMLARAHLSLSQKRYERTVARLRTKQYSIVEENFAKLPEEKVPCIYSNGSLLCRYYAVIAPRSQIKAYIRAINDVISSAEEKK